MKTKKILTSILFLFWTVGLFAQSSVSEKLIEWGGELQTIINIIAGIGALWGVGDIGWKYYTGDENANKNLSKWVKGLAFVALAVFIINYFIPDSNL